MNTAYLPYYVSRAVFVALFCFLQMGMTLQAGLAAVGLFILFVIYLHSGWFSVDLSNPIFPLRRDDLGLDIQRKSLIRAIWVTITFNSLLNLFPQTFSAFPIRDINLLGLGAIVYFTSQYFQFIKQRIGNSGSIRPRPNAGEPCNPKKIYSQTLLSHLNKIV